ncbi:hypothetical protein BJY14_007598 [Actinomadura luteofluorescens]|uniref:Endonuclease GajA/Old nuclease/RecF-like AAA domain-containing protein n=1 Tax=Actinomadura luteofluorescens TaxID=46163 RepID=A0A7Y9EPM3_9ACTN|nr:hypothetical protein [Actinomadura luteofluorescens]
MDIRFDDITTFIGPNGVGKSAVLRALDWFFNGPPGGRGLTEDDVWAGAERKQISVGVEFSDLTDTDRNALGKYAAGDVQTVWLWRRWEDGSDKLSGRALTYPPFDEIRAIKGAMDRRKRYKTLSDEDPGLGLPPVKNAQELDDAMARWEREHPERLEGTELDSDTHFFGFAGQAKMTGLFDYVFVSADLRASEEGRDVKGSVIGRILNQAIDRSEAEEEMAELQILVNANRESIQSKHFGKQLESLSDQLTTEIEQLTMGRRVQVDSLVPELLLPQAQFQVSIQDGTARTRIDQQGHGFQRALLVTALRVLAQSAVTASDRTIFLAIEEPELFQHPVQAPRIRGRPTQAGRRHRPRGPDRLRDTQSVFPGDRGLRADPPDDTRVRPRRPVRADPFDNRRRRCGPTRHSAGPRPDRPAADEHVPPEPPRGALRSRRTPGGGQHRQGCLGRLWSTFGPAEETQRRGGQRRR